METSNVSEGIFCFQLNLCKSDLQSAWSYEFSFFFYPFGKKPSLFIIKNCPKEVKGHANERIINLAAMVVIKTFIFPFHFEFFLFLQIFLPIIFGGEKDEPSTGDGSR